MNTITPLLKANNLRHNTKSKQQRRGDDRVPPAAARLENDNVGGVEDLQLEYQLGRWDRGRGQGREQRVGTGGGDMGRGHGAGGGETGGGDKGRGQVGGSGCGQWRGHRVWWKGVGVVGVLVFGGGACVWCGELVW